MTDMNEGVDHDFERAVEGMDEDTVRAMYYIMRGNRDTLYEALERATEELRYCRDALMHTGTMTEDERRAFFAEIANCEAALQSQRRHDHRLAALAQARGGGE